jgi:hypothetical protein
MAGVPQAKPLLRIIVRPNDGTRIVPTRGFLLVSDPTQSTVQPRGTPTG